VGEGRRGRAAAHREGAGRCHADLRERGVHDGLGAAGQSGGQAGVHRAASAGDRRCPGHRDDGPAVGRGPAAREIAAKLRNRSKPGREETTQAIAAVTGQLADLAEKGAAQAAAVLRNPDARPIRKGRIDRPVEFGYKAQVTDNDDGIILDCTVEYGAAPDGPQLAPAIERIGRRAGRVPRAVTADPGYGQPAFERDLHELGVRTVAIPRRGTTSVTRKKVERSRGFHRLVKWRTGSEGRISYLKRGCGWDRTRLDGRYGAAIWCGHGVFAHNLIKIGVLAS
jgi:IS5 family transposase